MKVVRELHLIQFSVFSIISKKNETRHPSAPASAPFEPNQMLRGPLAAGVVKNTDLQLLLHILKLLRVIDL